MTRRGDAPEVFAQRVLSALFRGIFVGRRHGTWEKTMGKILPDGTTVAEQLYQDSGTPTKKDAMKNNAPEAIRLMYTALMQIGALEFGQASRISEIVAKTLSEMNGQHTRLVVEALGLAGKREK